jgi:hemolysin activation/secretion protein
MNGLVRTLCLPTLATALVVFAPLAGAQIAPDAGQSLRDLQPPPRLPEERTLDLRLPEDGTTGERAPEGGPSMQVEGFVLSGNDSLPSEELLALLADLEGRQLSLGELEDAAARLTRHYRAKGYPLARAYVPAQTIRDGRVEIAILEGRYGRIEVDKQGARLRDFALAPLKALEPGDPVRAAALERSLLLLNERAGASTRAALRPGDATGTTSLLVGLEPTPLLTGSLEYDNGGNRFTGADRLGASLGVNSPLALGDRLDLRLLGTREEQYYYLASYQLPLGRWGTSLGASFSYMEYELGKDFQDLDAHGTAHTGSVFVNQPLFVSRPFWLNARLQYDNKRLVDEVDLLDTESRKRSEAITFALEGNARDDLFGGGLTSFGLGWSHGDLSLRSPDDRVVDALSARTEGDFDVLRPTLVRLQRLTDRFSLLLRLRGQWADGNLDGSEEFGLGGAYGVRAYPQGEAQGDEGWLGNLELRYALTQNWQLSTFADHGRIRVNRDTWDDSDNHRNLSAMGVGASWASQHWRLDASSAWRIGNARPESDNHRAPRVWVAAAWLF